MKDEEVKYLKQFIDKFTRQNFYLLEFKGIDKNLMHHSNLNW